MTQKRKPQSFLSERSVNSKCCYLVREDVCLGTLMVEKAIPAVRRKRSLTVDRTFSTWGLMAAFSRPSRIRSWVTLYSLMSDCAVDVLQQATKVRSVTFARRGASAMLLWDGGTLENQARILCSSSTASARSHKKEMLGESEYKEYLLSSLSTKLMRCFPA